MIVNLDKIKKISEKPWFYPAALLLMGLVVYEYALPSLGYYWDDWEVVMFMKLNPSLRFDFYLHDRPFPWTYQLTHFLVGTNPIGWHIVTLLYRWGGVLLFIYSLMILWPRYVAHLRWLGALILFYPGFLQQSQSATKDRHMATFFVFALSIYLMVLAFKYPKWARVLFPLSWLTTFIHLFTTEYFSGLELVRPLLLWMFIASDKEKFGKSLRRTAFNYIPYLLITAFYFWCRIAFFPTIFHTTSRTVEIKSLLSGFQESFTGTVLLLLNRALNDLIYLTLQVWTDTIINFDGFTFQSRVAWFAFGLGILLTVVFAFFYDVKEKDVSSKASPAWVLVVGFVSFVLGAIPIWAIGKPISAGSWTDRFALAPLLGACLMVMAFSLWLVRPSGQKFILSFLLVFSIAAQVWTVNVYRRDWQTQLSYYWQLYWRVPDLQPGTVLYSFEQPSATVDDYADAGYAINILYHYQTYDGSLPYWFYTNIYRFDFKPDVTFKYHLRNLAFDGSTSNGIAVLHQTPDSCLLLLDTVYAGNPLFGEGQDALIPFSNLSRIIPDPEAAAPDPNIFGPEPPHNWCYFFEKADLARQTKGWRTVISLYQQAKREGFSPRFGAEYIPLIESYAQVGDWQKAYETTLAAQKTNAGLKKVLCTNWLRLNGLPSSNAKVVQQAKQSLGCTNF